MQRKMNKEIQKAIDVFMQGAHIPISKFKEVKQKKDDVYCLRCGVSDEDFGEWCNVYGIIYESHAKGLHI